jgi:hypothetical protein
MRISSRYIKYLIALVINSGAFIGHAQKTEPVITASIGGADFTKVFAVGTTVTIQDDKWWIPAEKAKLDLTGLYTIRNIITLKIKEDTNAIYKTKFTANVRVRITATNSANVANFFDTTLTVNYDTLTGAQYNNKNIIYFKNAYTVSAQILKLDSITGGLGNAPLKNFLQLDNEMYITREYVYNCTASSAAAITISNTTLATEGELQASWNAVESASEYDLEWVFVDSSSLLDATLYKTLGILDAKKIFTDNATRVSVTGTTYRIPALYDDKTVLFARVRPVQNKPSGQRYEGNWSSDNAAGLAQVPFDIGHETNLNWQATTSFAEEGKRKSVVQYFDGSLRSRQTVTKNNTDGTTVVAETFYDYQGRPVVQVLPAPTLSKLIGYAKTFNRDINGNEYVKNLYDSLITPYAYCDSSAPAMRTDSGAAKYYSAANTQVNLQFNKYIPDAQGFAFTETRYSQDNTGRIAAQSGVGTTHKLGSGHETKYYYGNPDQRELDGLFGTEAGYAAHYTKNMVRDANGQYSVSYVDMHGRTVATALAGNAPNGMDTLASNKKQIIIESMADSTNNTIEGLLMKSSRGVLVALADTFKFNYLLAGDSVTIKNCLNNNICYDCWYNLNITITDDCNNCRLPGQQPYKLVDSNFTFAAIDSLCNATVGFTKAFNVFLPEGNYTVTKQLSINKTGYEYYRDSIFMKKNTCKTFQDFYKEQIEIIKTQLECAPEGCDSCTVHTASMPAFQSYYMRKLGMALSDTALYRNQLINAYTAAIENCNITCNKTGEHTFIRKGMILDMTAPFGQYANPDTALLPYPARKGNIFDAASPKWRLPVYHDEFGNADSIFNSLGNLVPPADASISQEEFIANFKPGWGVDLLPYHLEYPKLTEFEKHAASQIWDEQFAAVETFADANLKGYLYPVTLPAAQVPAYFNNIPAGKDPIALTDSLLNTTIPAAVYSFKTIAGPHTFSMWGMASVTGKCTNPNNNCAVSFENPGVSTWLNPASFCTGELDMGWRTFRQLYLLNKRKTFMLKLEALYPVHSQVPAYRNEYFVITDDATDTYVNGIMGGGNPKGTFGTEAGTKFNAMYQQNCEDYAASWWTSLEPCFYNVTDDAQRQQDSLRLIPRMVQICVNGSDTAHTWGSSSTAPNRPLLYNSFETLLKRYMDSMHVVNPTLYPYDTLVCNPYTIYQPEPYNNQTSLGNIPLWTKPDSCQCATLNNYYSSYQQGGAPDTSFAAYIFRITGTAVANADLTKLRNLCSGADTCKFLTAPIYLPPALQCGIKDVCVTCTQVKTAYDSFKVVYSGVYPKYSSDDSTQAVKNKVFKDYMNYKLGFIKSTADYLGFMDNCGINYTGNNLINLCDTLKNIVDLFKLSYGQPLLPPLAYNANGCDTTTWFDSTIIRNVPYAGFYTIPGVVSLPQPVLDTVTTAFTNLLLQYTRCITNLNGGFTFAARIKARDKWPGVQGAKYFLLNFFGQGPGGGGLADYFYFYPSGINFNNGALTAPQAINIDSFRVYKLQFKNQQIKIYIDDTLRMTIPFAGDPYATINQFGPQFYNVDGKMDWMKIYDNDGNLVLDEQFNNGCTAFGIPKAQYRCTVAPCATSFVSYFNTQRGVNYTQAQADSVYLNNCGFAPNPCNKAELLLCGKNEPLFPAVIIDEPEPCADSSDLAFVKATELYKTYQDSLKNAFDSVYITKCKLAFKTEKFTATHKMAEYHYTLYYYDQGGNLVKTIPPEGVDVSKQSDTTWLKGVALARKNGTVQTPVHWLPTNYRYNGLNQVVAQRTPDTDTTAWFWYDRLGRLTVSQNAKQFKASATEANRNYSYTQYDVLGRITQVGEIKTANTTRLTQTISQDTAAYRAWFNTAAAYNTTTKIYANAAQITSTVYDIAYPPNIIPLVQRNLRNRVAYTTITLGNNPANFNQASFYTYDIHGNVDTLVQDYGNSSITTSLNLMNAKANRFKKMVYQFDLISGKVNHVAYQPGATDAFYHRYSYDAENRLTIVETSADSLVWEKDARYDYYRHGPLARTILGEQKVQGVDYAYTLQGWLKGVNSTTLNIASDMGNDGDPANAATKYVGRDAYSFSLNYFTGDYTAINAGVNPMPGSSAFLTTDYRPLYNGNISSMAVNISKFNNPVLYNYKYDQLNRLKEMDAWYAPANFNTTNSWSGMAKQTNYQERIKYDANGNITKYLRNGFGTVAAQAMDNLTYNYTINSGKLLNNRLNYVRDTTGSTSTPNANYTDDIDDQTLATAAAPNYTYDAIGNLTKDVKDSILTIAWTVYGKIDSITRTASTLRQVNKIKYTYDAAGNRISKAVYKTTTTKIDYTWYVRDASGNVMATYNCLAAGNFPASDTLYQSEVYLYGSSRAGSVTLNRNMQRTTQVGDQLVNMPANFAGQQWFKTFYTRGKKQYELTNHLGSTLVTISDKKIGISSNGNTIDYYTADVITANDYYPFGMTMPGRKYQQGNSKYRYGFGGQEKSNEIKGEGNSYTAEFWEYDPRVGRRWNVDPVKKSFESPYATFSNNPINRIDIHGNSDSTVATPNGGTMRLPDGAKITGVHNTNKGIIEGVRNGDGTQAKINVAKGSVFRFEFNGDTYNSLYNLSDGSFVGYGKNGSMVPSIGDLNSKIIEYKFGVQKPDTKTASVMAMGVAESPTPVPPQAKAVAAVVTAAAVATLTTITVQTIIHDLQITAPAIVTGGYYTSIEKANGKFLEELGIDAHELKKEWLGNSGKIAEYDIYKNKETGELEIFKKGGIGEGIKTGIKYIFDK